MVLEVGGLGYVVVFDVDFGFLLEIFELVYSFYEEVVQIVEISRLMCQVVCSLYGNLGEVLCWICVVECNIQELKDFGDIEFLEGDGDIEVFLKDVICMLWVVQGLKYINVMGEVK